MNNIYFIQGKQIYPVGDAGAVVIAKSKQAALKMVMVSSPSTPVYLGKSKKKSQVVFENTTDY